MNENELDQELEIESPTEFETETDITRLGYCNIVEYYPCIQGEGILIGRPSNLIRLAGCNLNCSWCDTPKDKPDPNITESHILSFINKHPQYDVMITGGEPTCDDETLYELLYMLGVSDITGNITIETNGTNDISFLDEYNDVLMWTVSPKLPSSGEDWRQTKFKQFFDRNSQFKFVVDVHNEMDLETLELILMFVPNHIPVTLQLVAKPDTDHDEYLAQLELLADYMLEKNFDNNIRVLPQLHKLIWGYDTQKR